jgi:hypothetical protein
MAETAQCYQTDAMDWLSMLRIVAKSAPQLGPLVNAGLRIHVISIATAEARLVVPSPHHGMHQGNKEMQAALTALHQIVVGSGKKFDVTPARATSKNLEPFGHPASALAVMASRTAVPSTENSAAPLADQHFALVIDDDEERLAATLGATLWQAPAVRLSVSQSGGHAAVLQFADVGTTVAAANALGASTRHENFHLLDIYDCGDVRLATKREARPSVIERTVPSLEALQLFADAITAFSVYAPEVFGDQAGGTTTFAVLGREVWQFPLPRQTAAAFQTNDEILEVSFRKFLPNDEALTELAKTWNRLPKAGHQFELRSMPTTTGEEKPDALLAQIKLLERKVALTTALRAPQFRLLRFSDKQVEAMVDALRCMPPETIDKKLIKYGFHASEANPRGVHYLCWSANAVASEEYFQEHLWRARTEDRPISYWIDPFWARLYADAGGRVKSRVMVPHGHWLSPTLHSFKNKRDSDMDQFLRDRFADGGKLEPGIEPIYLVNPSSNAGFTYTIETLDYRSFHPFDTQVKWINAVLEISATVELREYIQAAADASKRASVLKTLNDGNSATRAAMEEGQKSLEAHLSARLGAYLTKLTEEVDALSNHILRFGKLMDDLTAESVRAENVVAAMIDTTTSRAERLARVAEESRGLEADRKATAEGLLRAAAATEAFAETAYSRIQEAEDRLHRLRNLVAGLRYG